MYIYCLWTDIDHVLQDLMTEFCEFWLINLMDRQNYIVLLVTLYLALSIYGNKFVC